MKGIASRIRKLRTIPAVMPQGAFRSSIWIAELSEDTGVDFPCRVGQFVSAREESDVFTTDVYVPTYIQSGVV
eukprot:12419270-Karenia_brevis.AAC.1